jgi:hypothetical protein
MSTEGSNAVRKWAQRHTQLGTCKCGKRAQERHHPQADQPRRIVGFCRRCHYELHTQPRDKLGRWERRKRKVNL